MTKLTESAIEAFAIQLFERLGYTVIYAPDITPDGDHPERARYDEVLLTGRLEKALQRINPGITATVLQTVLKEIERIPPTPPPTYIPSTMLQYPPVRAAAIHQSDC